MRILNALTGRTIKEQFVYRNEDWIEYCDLANERIKDWLWWYIIRKEVIKA
jgi:hypothetical protein